MTNRYAHSEVRRNQIEADASGSPQIGVAISGGGHRATLWGLGVLLFLADSGLNRQTSTISSVSGGSIINGAVMQRVDFRTASAEEFREAIQPVLTHITKEGLFFYGKPTNSYLRTLLALGSALISFLLSFFGLAAVQLVRFLLDDLERCACSPLESVTLWIALVPAVIVFPLVAWAANRYAEHNDWGIDLIAGLAAAVVIALMILSVTNVWHAEISFVLSMYLLVLASSLATLALVLMFVRRSHIAEHALKEAYFGEDTLGQGPQQHSHKPAADSNDIDDTGCLHVICATDLATGNHAYFSDRFIYNSMHGLSTRMDRVKLATAVQASAALPGAFNARRISKRDMDFHILWNPDSDEGITAQALKPDVTKEGIAHHPLIVVDGGVYDNMADQWFQGIDRRRDEWTDFGTEFGALIPEVDFLVLANASAGWRWRPAESIWSWVFLTMREISALSRDYQITYNTIARRRRRHIVDLWKHTDARGALVQIDRAPDNALNPRSPNRERIEQILAGLGMTEQQWVDLVRHSDEYKTVLRRVKPERARKIIWHAYVLTAVSVSSWLGTDMIDLVPLEEFADVDEGFLKLNSGP